MKTFIVEFWSNIFGLLGKISLFQLARTYFPSLKEEPGAVELYVLVNFAASILFLVPSDAPGWSWWEILIVAYCALHVYEVVIYQINVILFDAYRAAKAGKSHQLRGYRRLVLLLLVNYAELIFCFAVIYRHMSESFSPVLNSFGHAIRVSFSTMSRFGAALTSPSGGAAALVLQLQAVIGFVMTIFVLARFISIIPKPETADEIEKSEQIK